MDLLLHSKLCFSQLGNPLLCNYWQLVLKMYVTSLRQFTVGKEQKVRSNEYLKLLEGMWDK